jgi:formate dehydrogenase major subunit
MLRVTINGSGYEVPADLTLLQACLRLGIDVPHVCHDERVKAAGSCRLCMVTVEGAPEPVLSCTARVQEGMVVRTHSGEIETVRRTLLGLMADHYGPAIAATQRDVPFERYMRHYGIEPGPRKPATTWRDATHPYIGVDMDRCIYCYRCVRICEELQGQFVWRAWERGPHTYVRPATGSDLLTSECTSCGACVDTCPSGALFDKAADRLGAPEQWTRTTCAYCAVGCQMEVGSRGDTVVAVRPAHAPTNRGHLCVKGRYAFEFTQAPDRQTEPMIRRGGAWHPVTWDEALDFTAGKLREIVDREGPDAVGLLGSARATNEDNYLMQKLARVAIGTNNVDACARVCHQPSAAALKHMLGAGAATNSFDDIERAALIMICGANPTVNHPVVGARIKQAVLRGAKLIVADPRATELARYADLHIAVTPGRNIPLFNAMAAVIVEEQLVDRTFLEQRVDDYDAFAAHVRQFVPEVVAAQCGVAAEAIRRAARLYAGCRPAMCFHGLGMTEHTQGTEAVMTLINLALLTGNVGKPGSGVNPLRGQNNVQGSAHMGCEPGTLTGGQSITGKSRERFGLIWGAPIPERHGLSLPRMLDRADAGRLRALWACGYDVYLSMPDANAVARALARLELVIVQDLFVNEIAREFGTVFLPAASAFERDGTFMNSDRRVQRIRQVVAPRGQARPDHWIISEIAHRLGAGAHFRFESAEDIWNEVRRVWPAGAGMTYSRIEQESLHWPCPTEDHPGTPILHVGAFASGPRAALRRIEYVPTPEVTDERYPLLLTTGRDLYNFNAGTMTLRTPNAGLHRADLLDLAPDDAAAIGVADGDYASIRSRYGEAVLPVRVSTNMRPGTCFTTFHHPAFFVNRVVSPRRDRYVETPEYKVTAVAVARAESAT